MCGEVLARTGDVGAVKTLLDQRHFDLERFRFHFALSVDRLESAFDDLEEDTVLEVTSLQLAVLCKRSLVVGAILKKIRGKSLLEAKTKVHFKREASLYSRDDQARLLVLMSCDRSVGVKRAKFLRLWTDSVFFTWRPGMTAPASKRSWPS